MPSLSIGLHPSVLQGFRPPSPQGPAPGPSPFRPPMPGPMPPMAGPGPMFPGAPQPGAFGQPAPFNPFLAQALLAMRGGFAPQATPPGPGLNAPMGRSITALPSQTPTAFQPRRRNPYV